MRALLPVLVAGGTFAAAAVLGLLAGIAAASRFGQPLFAPLGLVVGAAIGGYCALRVVVSALQ